jgi:hypothetical protein
MAEMIIPDSSRIIRVGVCGTGPFSFYGLFNSIINNTFREYNNLNMRITHIWGDDYSRNYRGSTEYIKKMTDFWNSEKQSPKGLSRLCGIPNVCEDFHEMVNNVDAAMIMDFDRAYELSEPFLRRGLPIFICSPVAVNVAECEKILDLAEKNGAAVHTGAYRQSLYENRLRNDFVMRDNIASFFALTSLDYYTSYAPDGLDPLYWFIGPGVRKVALHGWDGSKGFDPSGLPPFTIYLEYEPRGSHPPIQGALTCGERQKKKEWCKIYYYSHDLLEGITQTNWGKPEQRTHELTCRDFIMDIQQVFATNKPIETRNDILNKLRVLIAAYKSANEGNMPIFISEVKDYRLPTVRIEKWNEIPQ